MVIILMGVSGCGKSTVGERLAAALGWRFADADNYHPPENVEKMHRGIPLSDADREPWLQRLSEQIRQWNASGESAVLACSALTRRSRELLGTGEPGVRLVHLNGPRRIIQRRLAARRGHYMPAQLLDSQFAALQEPEDALVMDIGPEPERIVQRIRSELGL